MILVIEVTGRNLFQLEDYKKWLENVAQRKAHEECIEFKFYRR
jgi:hypothetical protein